MTCCRLRDCNRPPSDCDACGGDIARVSALIQEFIHGRQSRCRRHAPDTHRRYRRSARQQQQRCSERLAEPHSERALGSVRDFTGHCRSRGQAGAESIDPLVGEARLCRLPGLWKAPEDAEAAFDDQPRNDSRTSTGRGGDFHPTIRWLRRIMPNSAARSPSRSVSAPNASGAAAGNSPAAPLTTPPPMLTFAG
jgi:hypothetical protein